MTFLSRLWYWLTTSEYDRQTLALAREFKERLVAANLDSPRDYAERLVASLEQAQDKPVPFQITATFENIVEEGYRDGFFAVPILDLQKATRIEKARWRDTIRVLTKNLEDPQTAIGVFEELARDSFNQIVHHLPVAEQGPFAVPVYEHIRDFRDLINNAVVYHFIKEVRASGHFLSLRNKLEKNILETSRKKKAKRDTVIMPKDYDGPPRHLLNDYLHDTYFEGAFDFNVPFGIPPRARFEHCIITGGSGHGKTQLLQTLILDDLKRDDRPSIVVVDSQGEMLEKIARLALFKDRDIIILDPRDNPALNVFDINQQRLRRYGREQREQVLNHTLETFSYLFNSVIGADLTVKQSVLFTYLIYLMLAMPESMGRNATLLDLMKLMDDPEPYRPAIEALDPIPRDFFLKDFGATQYRQTKEQIRYRLQAIIGNSTLARLFLAPDNTVDFFDELNKGSVILIDTSKAFLGAKNSSYLGRIAITLILQAILERGASSAFKHPVHVYVDEAAEYFDKSIDTFLTEARKQYAGITLAHQYLGQMTGELRASVAANTSVKFAGGLSTQDAKAVAPDMRTDPDYITNQPKLTFACYVRGHTPSAVALHVTPGALEGESRMSDDEYKSLRTRNRLRVSAPPLETKITSATTVSEPPSIDEPDRPTTEW